MTLRVRKFVAKLDLAKSHVVARNSNSTFIISGLQVRDDRDDRDDTTVVVEMAAGQMLDRR